MRKPAPTGLAVCAALWLGLVSPGAGAVQRLELDLGSLQGAGWALQTAKLWLEPGAEGHRAELEIGQLQLDALTQALPQLRLSCPLLEWSATHINCRQGSLSGAVALFEAGTQAEFSYALGDGALALKLQSKTGGAEGFNLSWNSSPDGWQLDLQTQAVSLQNLSKLLAYGLSLPEGLQLGGRLDARLRLEAGARLQRLEFSGKTEALSYSNAAGTQAGENLSLDFSFTALPRYNRDSLSRWQVRSELHWRGGEVYSAPLYLQHGGAAASLQCGFEWYPQGLRLLAKDCSYRHPGVTGLLLGQLDLNLLQQPVVQTLQAELEVSPLAQMYHHYLRNWLEEAEGYAGLELDGRVGAVLDWNPNQRSIDLNLQQVQASLPHPSRPDQHYRLDNLSGVVHWQGGPASSARPSLLNWDAIQLPPQIGFGPASLRFSLQDGDIKLLKPLDMPVLDGRLQVEKFNLKRLGQTDMEFNLAEIHMRQPVSMQALSQALQWPELGGKVSGMIPAVSYSGQNLQVRGAVLLQVFEGDIVVHQLRMQDPFGLLPRLSADIDLEKLNLYALTRYFSFGDISGNLSGYIKGLLMLRWQPVAFDAKLYTPGDDPPFQTISQKALGNLESLGGSQITDALSRGVLGFLDQFFYKRIGWGCRLANGVCEMSGVRTTAEGYYYLVEGSSMLPASINVIGHNRRVNWDDFITRLKSAIQVNKQEMRVE